MESEIFKSFATNGPWAVMAGFLLWQVMKAWEQDRKQLKEFLVELKSSLDKLTHAVEAIATWNEHMEQMEVSHRAQGRR